MVCSAVVTLLASGVFITTMPRAVAASMSTLSTPLPATANGLETRTGLQDGGIDLRARADNQRVIRRHGGNQFPMAQTQGHVEGDVISRL